LPRCDQLIAKVAFGIDRVEAHRLAQFLAQFADMALDDAFLDLVVEETIDGVEYLIAGDAPTAVGRKIFEDAALTPWQREDPAVDLGIAANAENAQALDVDVTRCLCRAAADGANAGNDLAGMHRFSHDIVDARREELEGGFEGGCFVERDGWNFRTGLDGAGDRFALAEVAKNKGFDRREIGPAGGMEPVIEVVGCKTGR
jgi:hypothetical protein